MFKKMFLVLSFPLLVAIFSPLPLSVEAETSKEVL
ncbi:MAG: hypothetical protein DDT19_00535 [Syntrophomonadaceae bacterium]|nr:hypothetical protein [Bacillota bacterium]